MRATLTRYRRNVTTAVIVLPLAVATLVASSADDPVPSGINTPTGPMELPDEWMTAQRMSDGRTELDAETYAPARAAARSIEIRTRSMYRHLANQEWEFFGPSDVGGRVVDIAVDPDVEDQIFIAAASGGVWKSSDAGTTFETAWPDDWVQGMGAVAITESGVLYAGTGEAQPGGGSITFGGNGIYRSYDRGETWEHVGLKDSHAIARFAIDPSDEDRVFAAAAGNLFTPGGERGVYLTEDGGDTWTQVLAPPNDRTGATEVLIDPSNPDRVYAAMWDHLREPHQRTYGGAGSSLWRSDDGGETWERMTNGLPTDDNQGRWGLALAPSDPERLYAYVGDKIGPFRGFFRSDDGGDSWYGTPTGPVPPGQGTGSYGPAAMAQSTFSWWFGKIWVDPLNPDHVFVAGTSLLRSTSGALPHPPPSDPAQPVTPIWTNVGGVHADQHVMRWDPKVPNRAYLGNDGGTYRSANNGATGWVKATYEPYTQFYSVDTAETNTALKVGGAQDNGCNRGYNGVGGAWDGIGCGDGLQVIIHPEDPTIVFACSQYGSCTRSTNSGGTPRPNFTNQTTSARRNWFTPVQFDPSDPDVMYYAGNIVNRSTDNGRTWTAISPDLTGGGPNDPGGYPWGTVTTVAAAPTDGDTLYAGTDDGKLWWTDDVGANWHEVDPEQLPGTWVTRVAVSPADEDVAYATFSGFRSGSDRPHVMVTQDGGVTWTDIGKGLPDAPVNSIVPTADGLLLVGTDVGVYVSAWNGGEWATIGASLPNAAVMYMRYHEPSRQLSVATFGRGIYQVDVPICRGASTRLPLRQPGVGVAGTLASCRP